MQEEIFIILNSSMVGLVYVALSIILLALAGITKDLLTPFSLQEELSNKDNPALGLSLCGYYIGIFLIFVGVIYSPGENILFTEVTSQAFIFQALEIFAYSIMGIILLNLARFLVDKLVLNQFSVHKEIIEDRNVGTGAVEFGSYVASGLVIAGALSGEVQLAGEHPPWIGVVSALTFFSLGQLVLIVFSKIYQLITPYDLHAEIERDNVAAGVAFGGNLVALGMVMFKAVSGNLESWALHFLKFGLWTLIGFVILVLLRFLVNNFFMPNSSISHEIKEDQNLNAGFIEGTLMIGFAALIYFAL